MQSLKKQQKSILKIKSTLFISRLDVVLKTKCVDLTSSWELDYFHNSNERYSYLKKHVLVQMNNFFFLIPCKIQWGANAKIVQNHFFCCLISHLKDQKFYNVGWLMIYNLDFIIYNFCTMMISKYIYAWYFKILAHWLLWLHF